MFYFELKSVREPVTLLETTAERVFDFIIWMLKDSLPTQFRAGKGKDVFRFLPLVEPSQNRITVSAIWSREFNGSIYYPADEKNSLLPGGALPVWEFVVLPLQQDVVLLDVRVLADLRDDSMYGERWELLEDIEEIIEMFTERGVEIFQRIADKFTHNKILADVTQASETFMPRRNGERFEDIKKNWNRMTDRELADKWMVSDKTIARDRRKLGLYKGGRLNGTK
jgi:hypothetical protein